MLSFEQFINEAAASSTVSSDDKGKMHELLLAKHLHPNGTLPEHHRSESKNPLHSGTAQQVHDKLKERMTPAAYAEIDRHAKQSADEFKKSFPHKITNVHWTSNPDTPSKAGDHEKTTGVKDVNSNADLILTHSKGFHGISAKYGSGSVNYKNPGIADIERTSGAKENTFRNLLNAHHAHMEKLGYTGARTERHAQWKDDKTSNTSRYNAAKNSSLSTRTEIARLHANALSKKSDSELRDYIRSNVAANTHIPHSVVHTKVSKATGSAQSLIHDPKEHIEKHLSNYENLSVKHSGIRSVVTGIHKKTGKESTVASTTIKATSGPHKGDAAMFKLK